MAGSPNHEPNAVPAPEVLPCGCVLTCAVVAGVNELTIAACRPGCPNLANALELAGAASLPVERRLGP